MDNDISVELARLRWHHAALRFELSMLRHARALRSKYNPDQPRVSAGSPIGGQWTRGSSGVRVLSLGNAEGDSSELVLSDAVPDSLIEGAQYAQANVTIDYSNALTGLSNVDDTTRELTRTLAQTMSAMDFIPEWTPQVYGTEVHVAFGTNVRLQSLPGIGFNDVEQGLIGDGDLADYGQSGSIRTDVVLRNDSGDIIAIYDVKTGGAKLTTARVRELRQRTGVSSSTPIIELHVVRGATIKSRVRNKNLFRLVVARLWNPLLPDSVDRATGR